ncbi:hypothetical protein Tco_0848262 [Tanacetum coccineum]
MERGCVSCDNSDSILVIEGRVDCVHLTMLAVEAARRFEASSSLAMVSAKATIDSLRRDGFDVGGGVYEG